MKKNMIIILVAAIQVGCAPDQNKSTRLTAFACEIPARQVQKNLQSFNLNQNEKNANASNLAQFKNFIVKFKSQVTQGLTPSGKSIREFQVKGLSLKVMTGNTFTFSMQNKSDQEKQTQLHDLATDASVDYIEPDFPIYSIDPVSVGPIVKSMDQNEGSVSAQSFTDQWALNTVNVQGAWNLTQGSKDILVAVLDSGIDYTHNDLKNNMWKNPSEVINGLDDDENGYVDDVYGWNFANNNSDPISKSTSNHGTHVAGIVGAAGTSLFGIAPNVKLMALKFIGENGSGATSDAIRGIDYAIKKKVFAINNSWGSASHSQALAEAITRAEKAGILFVVAAGNGGSNGLGLDLDRTGWYPASYTNSNIMTVAATGSQDMLANFSNFGKTMVDVAAPGLSILSTVSGQGYQRLSGTSMAAPLVTGLSVLVKAANPALNYKQIITLIRNSVDRISTMTNSIASGGRVNAFKSVRAAVNAGSDPGGTAGFNCGGHESSF